MNWEPWTGCYKVSEGCRNCYFYGPHAKRYDKIQLKKLASLTGRLGKLQKVSIISKAIKFYQLALPPTFFFQKQMSGEKMCGS